jgi:hypothetical protein
MNEFPTPDDVARELAAEQASKLLNETEEILNGGGSDESLELADELVSLAGRAVKFALTSKDSDEPISSEEMLDVKDREIENGNNPYPKLTLEESRELQRLSQLRSRTKAQWDTYTNLQKKALRRD